VLIENVPGMLSLDEGRMPALILAALKSIGYNARLGILQAGYYGLPQNRWRVFILAAVRGLAIPAFPNPQFLFPRTTIFGAKSFRPNVIRPREQGHDLFFQGLPTVTVGDAISDLPKIANGGGHDETCQSTQPATDYQRELRNGATFLYDHRCSRLGELMLSRCAAVPKRPGAGWLDLPDHLKPRNLLRHGDRRYDNRFGRLHWDGTFNTILTKPEPYWGAVFHPAQNRVISVRECARAQGFPDSVRFCGKLYSRYRQVGNAVPVPLARALGRELMRAAGLLTGTDAALWGD
jgi:DNA (cytosine-5)-methyltransferase 1